MKRCALQNIRPVVGGKSSVFPLSFAGRRCVAPCVLSSFKDKALPFQATEGRTLVPENIRFFSMAFYLPQYTAMPLPPVPPHTAVRQRRGKKRRKISIFSSIQRGVSPGGDVLPHQEPEQTPFRKRAVTLSNSLTKNNKNVEKIFPASAHSSPVPR